MKSRWMWALVLALMAGAVTAGVVSATPQSGVTTSFIVNKIPLSELDLKAHTIPADTWQLRFKTQGITDGYVVDNVLHPGGTTGWHSHPGPSLIYVIKGEVTNYESDDPTCAGQVYTAPAAFVDEGGDHVHKLVNAGTIDAETIAVQFLPQGAPRRIEADVPSNCPS
ncbi:MAG TPA: hypothetical protein VLB89_08185 [Gaiellaceae bacterium]|nr:hypothetical protein [Gaiellaceae bacterium]